MKLTQDQIKILSDWKIEENRFYLQWQLDRKQYLNIDEVLNTIWLIWNKWKKAHIAEWLTKEDLINSLDDIVDTWEVETLQETIKKFQFYPTPKEVAKYLVELADIKNDESILEPSAWKWNIINEIPAYVSELVAVELNKENYDYLIKTYIQDEKNRYSNCDFLDFRKWLENYDNMKFDKIIANPPFSKSQDVKHILHMYELLNNWWTIVSIASNWITFKEWKLYDELRKLNPEIIELPEWSFKNSWTMVNTVIIRIKK